MKWWILWWLLLSHDIIFKNHTCGQCNNNTPKKCSQRGRCNRCCSKGNNPKSEEAKRCMENVTKFFTKGNKRDSINAIEDLENFLEETEVDDITFMSVDNLVAALHKPKGSFEGLEIYASENQASDKPVANSKVRVQLPKGLDVGSDNTIVLCSLPWPETNVTIPGASGQLYENRMHGLSVHLKSISGLQERVNITMNLTTAINDNQTVPICVFYNFLSDEYSNNGCLTLWVHGQDNITCSCDHLTYFGVLVVSEIPSPEDQEILTYISVIGCGLSLFSLVITVLLFFTNRKLRGDVSMRIHISLVFALILLNLHFLLSQIVTEQSPSKANPTVGLSLPNETVTEQSPSKANHTEFALEGDFLPNVTEQPPSGVCLYIAISLHYSLLASFTWMALEGFHIYLLLVRVFNIYVRRYVLKLSVVGWGIPAVIVSLVAIIDIKSYRNFVLDPPNSTSICFVTGTAKTVTVVGALFLVFTSNVILIGMAIRRVLSLRQRTEGNIGTTKRDICTLLGVSTLFGVAWGLAFFSFGYLNTTGLYLFCILNSLQGFFIFLWFVMSLRKNRSSATTTTTTTEAHSSNR
ncbi:adhesion G protein-coupled receptor G3-like isoform X1 [Toxotes jaculatrix]|uniref:adhesion G protein-coupled receptor G3-like isoform X1 n=1 Tax=Toxotes jaculatrix TaxID=941984 RepID=UPI001B3AE325|nr:adhesion G protein-coupled receptor G3-like isoform X1 [Toxotes jaculatrix]